MRIALGQINSIVGDLQGNKAKIIHCIEQAKKLQSDIIAFPELAICGYPPEDLLYKKHFVEENIRVVRSLAKYAKGIVVVVGFVDADGSKNIYNAAGIMAGGSLQGVYHKKHLPNYGVFDERRYFKEGKDNKVFSCRGITFGVNVCEDIWADSKICRGQAQLGAKVIFNISSSPYDVGKLKEREKLLVQRAKESRAFLCYVNIVGGQDELVFDGTSLVVHPSGKIIAFAKELEEDLLVCDLDIVPSGSKGTLKRTSISVGSTKERQKSQLPVRDLNRKLTTLERVQKALILGTRDYVCKNNFSKVLIGLSGGIDSSLVAAIACDAVGKNNVVGVTMPSRFSSTGTKTDAKALANNLGIEFMEIPIEGAFDSYHQMLKPIFKDLPSNITEENIQARIRGNILMALANKFGWLVLTTGNKSEVAVGYCTLYGDMSGGFAVIKDVPKTTVYELAKLYNQQSLTPVIPLSVIDRAPTAELRAGQKDQDTLPPYDILDEILKLYVEKHQSFEVIAKKFPAEVVQDVLRMVDRSEYKRRQSPPGIKITPMAFGKDWRLPITNKFKGF